MSKFGDEEPTADMRQMAAGIRSIFVALVQSGFTEKQALSLLAEILKSSVATFNKD